MGAQVRRAVEGFATLTPVVRHVLAMLRRLVGRWYLGRSLAETGGKARCARPDRVGRKFCRRHVCPGKKGGDRVVPTKRGKGTKLMVLVDGAGLPLASDVDSASPAEVSLIEPLLEEAVVQKVSPRLIYDRAADSAPLRKRLAEGGIELNCPHRRRRIIERIIRLLQSFRRLVTRYQHYAVLFH